MLADNVLAEQLVGRWDYVVDYGNQTHEVVYRFYDTGIGYLTSDSYNANGSSVGYGRGAFDYWVEDGLLYIQHVQSDEAIKYMLLCNEDSIVLTAVDAEDATPVELIKQGDADYRFWGSWYIQYIKGDYYYEDKIKCVTSTDCCTYYCMYDNPNGQPTMGPTEPIWYKYKFDNNKLYMYRVDVGKNATPATKEYRLDGTKLYIKDDKTDGEWWCYSNFYEENGLEFRP